MRNVVIVLSIILIVICSIIGSIESFETSTPTPSIKILNLVLYSTDNNGPYDKMYKILTDYYKRFSNVTTVFYTCDSTITTKYKLDDNILFIQCEETYIPGILNKTISAFEYFENEFDNYDYIVRSNVSTIIQFDLLVKTLNEYPLQYGGGMAFDLNQWIEENNVLRNKKDTAFIGGTGIIMSKEIMKEVMKKKHLLIIIFMTNFIVLYMIIFGI